MLFFLQSDETKSNIFGKSTNIFEYNIFPTSEQKRMNAFGQEIRSPSLQKEKVYIITNSRFLNFYPNIYRNKKN